MDGGVGASAERTVIYQDSFAFFAELVRMVIASERLVFNFQFSIINYQLIKYGYPNKCKNTIASWLR